MNYTHSKVYLKVTQTSEGTGEIIYGMSHTVTQLCFIDRFPNKRSDPFIYWKYDLYWTAGKSCSEIHETF